MTPAEQIKKEFDPYYPLPVEEWEGFISNFDEVSFKKNEIIKQAWQIEKYGYYLLKGSCGNFIWKENNYVCLDLFFINSFFNDHMSMITNTTTPIETRALENCKALRISRIKIDDLKQTLKGAHLFLIGAESSYVEKQKQQIDLLLKSPEERYLDLINQYPESNNIPVKYLASYLGVTPQSLSRIRGRKLKSNKQL